MAARMEKTRHPGIYKRGSRYVVVWRANGKQHRQAARTLDEARKLKSARVADVARGEFHAASRVRFREYAEEWVKRYHGRRRGFRESTREDYKRDLEKYAFPFFDERLGRTVSEITPRDVANYVGWLCEQRLKNGKPLSDAKVRNAVKPVSACLSTAVREGLIRHNPARGVDLPHRPNAQELDDDEVRAFSREQLAAFLAVVHPRHGVMFRLLAATGLRVSELIALKWKHVALDGSRPHVKVRRTLVRGREQVPKTKQGRREVPIDPGLVSQLRGHREATEWSGGEDLVFPSLDGTALEPGNLRRRVIRPVAEEVGAPWAGFHTFRHTCASMLFERGANAVQVQRWLGHHSAAFTLATYVHLLDDNLGEPLALTAGDNRVTTEATGKEWIQAKSAEQSFAE
jgi:integrase